MVARVQVGRAECFNGLFPMALLCAVLLAPTQSDAKGLVLITYGDDISKVTDIPQSIIEEIKQSTGASNPQIGYKYSTFGIFFLDIWTWSGDYVIFENDTYWDLGKEGAARMLGVAVDDLKTPFFYTLPPGLIVILVLIIGVLLFVFVFSRSDKKDAPAQEAASDPNKEEDDEDD